MTFVAKIFQNCVDEDVHERFIRFGKGVYEHRAVMEIAVKNDLFHIYASYDLLPDLLEIATQLNGELQVSGTLITQRKKREINEKMTGAALCETIRAADFALLDVTGPEFSLKCKKKSVPKPGKDLDAKFCSAELPLQWLKEFVFEKSGFKNASVDHTFEIVDFIVPDQYKNDPAAARIHAKRKCVITRSVTIDGALSEQKLSVEV